jgi:hypothetical protein
MRSPSRLRLVRPSSIATASPRRSPWRSGWVPDSALFVALCPRDPPPAGRLTPRNPSARSPPLPSRYVYRLAVDQRPNIGRRRIHTRSAGNARATAARSGRKDADKACPCALSRLSWTSCARPVRPSVCCVLVVGRQSPPCPTRRLAAGCGRGTRERMPARSEPPPREDPSRSSGWTTSRAGPGRIPPQPRARRHPPRSASFPR